MISKITRNLTWRTEKSPFLIGKSSINGPFPVRYVSLLETGGYVKWIMRNCDVGFGKASWRNHDCDSRTLWNLPMYGPNEQIQVPPFAIIRHSSPIPIGSMYAIYGNIYHQYTPNVRHGSYGIWTQCFRIAIAKRIAKPLPGGLGHASPLAPLRSALGAASQSAGTWAVAGESGDLVGWRYWRSWEPTVMAMATSYNWWFLWGEKHSIHGVTC